MQEMSDHQSIQAELVGRRQEYQTLLEAFELARAGRGRLILVGGEAGIGKTTLVEHVLVGLHDPEQTVVTCACYDEPSPPPYASWRDAFGSIQGLGNWLDEVHLTSIPDQHALFRDVLQRLNRIVEHGPTIILIEDIHWADRESLELLRFIGRSIHDLPVLLIATYRNDELSTAHPLHELLLPIVRETRSERIDLRRLSESDVGRIVDNRYGLEAPDRHRLTRELYQRTAGNPLFIVELLRAMESTYLVRDEAGNWTLTGAEEAEIPLMIRQVIDRRLRELDPAARELIQVASIIGYELRPDALLAVIGGDEAGISSLVQQALDVHLLEQSPRGPSLRFRHALVQEALYAGVPVIWRQVQHRRIAEHLSDMPDADPAIVASHYYLAGDTRASYWLLVAARAARKVYAPNSVIRHVDLLLERPGAVQSDDLLEAHQLRGWANEMIGAFVEALHDFESALRIARDNQNRSAEWEALMRLAELWAGRDFEQAGELIHQALDVAENLEDPLPRAHSLNRLGNWFLNREQPDEAYRHHCEALLIFRATGDPAGIGATEDLLGMTSFLGGNLIDGAVHYEAAIKAFDLVDNRQALASSLANYSMRGLTHQTDMMVPTQVPLNECIQDAQRAIDVADTIGFRAGAVYARLRLGSLMASKGHYQSGLALCYEALAGAESIGHQQWLAAIRCIVATIYLDMLDPHSARSSVELGRDAAEQSGTIHWVRSNSGIRALALVATGLVDDAVAEIGTDWDQRIPSRTLAQRWIWRAGIEIELARNDPERAIRLTDHVIDSTAYASRDHPAVRLTLLRAQALRMMEEYEQAVAWLTPALSAAHQSGARPLVWRFHLELGLAHRTQGRRDRAREEFNAARRIVDEIGADMDDVALRDRFINSAYRLIPNPPGPTSLQAAKEAAGGLTRRQREVAVLITSGHTNREIADALSISERTVETHITAILSTLNLSSRTEIAAWAVQRSFMDG